MKYCPNCGAEYRPGYERCSDCGAALVDERPEDARASETGPTMQDRVVVFRSGRRMDAEIVRSRLEADGLDARIWSGGLGPWRLEAALTEVTGVSNDFNSHQVVVNVNDVERALEVLDEVRESAEDAVELSEEAESSFLAALRKRWMLLAFAIFMLLLVIVVGPIGS